MLHVLWLELYRYHNLLYVLNFIQLLYHFKLQCQFGLQCFKLYITMLILEVWINNSPRNVRIWRGVCVCCNLHILPLYYIWWSSTLPATIPSNQVHSISLSVGIRWGYTAPISTSHTATPHPSLLLTSHLTPLTTSLLFLHKMYCNVLFY